MKKSKKFKVNLITGLVVAAAAIVFSLLTVTVDVRPAGLEGTEIGFAALNTGLSEIFPFRPFWYTLTQLLGYFAICCMVFFFCIGLAQLIKRKNPFRVNAGILMLGVVYAVLFIIYVFFELKVVNYRPVLMPGKTEPEASFPSSHTMLANVVFLTGAMQLHRWIHRRSLRDAVTVAAVLLTVLTVVGRFFSGAHWFTDVCAGSLISLALVLLYRALCIPALEAQKKARKASAAG